MEVLLDTSVIIDFLRREKKEKTWLYSLSLSGDTLFASILTHTELYAGKSVWEKREAQRELEEIFSGIILIPLTQNISLRAGKLRARYNLHIVDAIIAATALEEDLPLATFNQKDFSKVASLNILRPPF